MSLVLAGSTESQERRNAKYAHHVKYARKATNAVIAVNAKYVHHIRYARKATNATDARYARMLDVGSNQGEAGAMQGEC